MPRDKRLAHLRMRQQSRRHFLRLDADAHDLELIVLATEDVERLYAELSAGAPALLAAADERPVSIITKADLLEFVAHQRRAR